MSHKTHLGPSLSERLSKLYPPDEQGWSSVKTTDGRSIKVMFGVEWAYALPHTSPIEIVTGEGASLILFK